MRSGDRKRDQDMDAHRYAALAEDARFLLDTGMHRDLVARRLGMTWDGVEKLLAREKPRSTA